MGMFRRNARENARWQEGKNRQNEFELFAQGIMAQFQSMLDINHPKYEQANLPENQKKLLNLAKRYRDDATRLNLHHYCALFSSIHFRTYFQIHKDDLSETSSPKVTYGLYGCRELQELQSDIRYLAWGVHKSGVDPIEYWETKDILDVYEQIIVNDVRSKCNGGRINVVDDFNSPPKSVNIELDKYLDMLKPISSLYTPPVPPRK